MTLVDLDQSSNSSLMSMMLSVQSQYNNSSIGHRGNVIVANSSSSNNNNNNGSSKVQQQSLPQSQVQQKKKMYAQSTPYTGAGHQPASVARRNARERNRVKQVNNGFATLRQHIPQSLAQALGSNTAGTQGGARAGSKKLSKVETLRMAVEYIRNLQQLLDEHDAELGSNGTGASSNSSSSPQTLDIKFELKSESGDEHYPQQVSPQRQSPVYAQASCSEASSSPTPSFVSESSSVGGPTQTYGANFTTTIYPADGYDNYEPMSPEEAVLLDYISNNYMWPQAQ